MKPNKNIDRLFQEKLKDLEVTPPDIVWKNIEVSLKKKKERRVFPIWLRIGTAAAILLLATIGGINYFNSSSSDNNIIITDIQKNKESIINKNSDDSFEINTSEKENSVITSVDVFDENSGADNVPNSDNNIKLENISQTETTVANNKNSATEVISDNNDVSKKSEKTTIIAFENQQNNSNNNTKSKEVTQTIERNQNNNVASNTNISENSTNKSTETILVSAEKTTEGTNSLGANENVKEKKSTITYENIENLEDTLEYKLTDGLEDDNQEISRRWSVASVIAPVYYNSFSTKGSPLDLQFKNSPKEGRSSISYGVKVGYKFTEKLSLQSGVTMVDVGYTIGNVYINPSPQFVARGLENVVYASTGTILNVNAGNLLDQETVALETPSTDLIKGELSQEYGYIEVPLELKYNLTNGKLGVHIVAGFSTLFLDSNSVYVETSDFSSNLGEAKNLNSLNFSGNFGFDVDYYINKSLFINAAPMIKVYTSTFSENSENFEPYLIGFYTGINYRF